MNKGKSARKKFIMLLAVITSIIYIGWRILFTVPTTYGAVSLVFGIALVAAETIGVIEAFHHYRNMSSIFVPEIPIIPESMYPDVDVFIATHSESVSLLYKTVNGCKHMKYPDKSKVHIYICDDTNRTEMKELAERMGVGYFGLSENKYAKSGNLNNAIFKTNSPLVATFDADMIPMSNFLMETVPYFSMPEMIKDDENQWRLRTEEEKDPKYKIGFIQTPQSFYNADLFQANFFAEKNIPNEQDYFFREVNVGRNRTVSPIYAGSNTVISRQALSDVGGIKINTITEDFATGIEIQQKGYVCYALPQALAHGMAPTSFSNLIKQRQRWGRGCVQTMKNFKMFFGPGLTIGAKLSYLSSLLYWWTFLRRFIYILSPILFTVFGVVVVKTTLIELLVIWLPSYLIYNHALKVLSGNIRNQEWSNIVDTILFPYMILPIFLETLGIKLKKFYVTSKEINTSRNSDVKYAIPHIMLLGATIIGLVFCFYNMVVDDMYGNIIIMYWLIVNGYFLVMAIMFMLGRVNYRTSERYYTEIDVDIIFDGKTLHALTYDISEGGLSVKLKDPEYIPYDEDVALKVTDDGISAVVKASVVHVQQRNGNWNYSFKILEMDDENKAEYFQIVYGREHTLAKSINSGPIKDVSSAVKGRASKIHNSNRRLPRIPMNVSVMTDKGSAVLKDFNYEYVSLENSGDNKKGITRLILPEELTLNLIPIEGYNSLYKVESWRENAKDMRLQKFLFNKAII